MRSPVVNRCTPSARTPTVDPVTDASGAVIDVGHLAHHPTGVVERGVLVEGRARCTAIHRV